MLIYKIYTKDNCDKCVIFKNIFNENNLEYEEIKLGRDITVQEFREKFPEIIMLPVITQGQHIYTDIYHLKVSIAQQKANSIRLNSEL